MKHLKKLVIILLACYLGLAMLSTFSGPDSIDEYSLCYWSNRVVEHLAHPLTALRLPPTADQLFGHIGFLRSGYFVYDKPLKAIFAGDNYHIVPMLHYIPIYVFALVKAVLGEWAHYFLHVCALVIAILCPVYFHIKYNDGRDATMLAALLLATPAYMANATYAMTDGIGTLAMSLFCCTIATHNRRATLHIPWRDALIVVIAILIFTFYKPIGIVFLPWSIFILVTHTHLGKRNLITAGAALALCLGVLIGAKNLYSNYLWAGYNNVLNHYVYKTHRNLTDIITTLHEKFSITVPVAGATIPSSKNQKELINYFVALASKEGIKADPQLIERAITNVSGNEEKTTAFDNVRMNLYAIYKPLGCITSYPFHVVLAASAFFTLYRKFKALTRPRFPQILREQFTYDLAFLFPCAFLFFFFMAYSQMPDLVYHIKLTTPLLRYLMILSIILVWYVIMNDALPPLRRLFPYILVLQFVVLLTFPQNIPMRVAFRAYSGMLQEEMRRVFAPNYVILGGYRYDKFFPPEAVPSYAFLAHQRSLAYGKCFDEYRRIVGSPQDLITRIYDTGHIPVVIYPDYIFPDDATVLNPYWDIKVGKTVTIDMAQRAGILGRFLPETYRQIHLAEVQRSQ